MSRDVLQELENAGFTITRGYKYISVLETTQICKTGCQLNHNGKVIWIDVREQNVTGSTMMKMFFFFLNASKTLKEKRIDIMIFVLQGKYFSVDMPFYKWASKYAENTPGLHVCTPDEVIPFLEGL